MAGVNTEDVPLLTALIGRLHSEGRTVLMVEHHMAVIVGLARRSQCSILDDCSRAANPKRSWPTRRCKRRTSASRCDQRHRDFGPTRSIAGSHVLQGVSFAVPTGGVTALLGRNGVGKTTTLRAILGLVASSGRIQVLGDEVAGWPTHRIVRLGIGYVPEDRDVFSSLSVEQNLRLAESGSGANYDEVFSLFPN